VTSAGGELDELGTMSEQGDYVHVPEGQFWDVRVEIEETGDL